MKKKMKLILIPVLVIIIFFIIFYLSMAAYYKQHFTFGTTINGYYCTGLSIENINQKLLRNVKEQTLSIEYMDGIEVIPLEDLSVAMDYTSELEKKLAAQKPLLWGMGIVLPNRIKVLPDIIFDESAVERIIRSYDFMKNHIYSEDSTISIVKDDTIGYILNDETQDLLDTDIAVKVIIEALHQGRFVISLKGNNCYRSLPEDTEMRKIRQQYDAIADFQNFSMIYPIGEYTEVIDAGIVANWIQLDAEGEFVFDNEGKPVLDRDQLMKYAFELSAKYGNQINAYSVYDTILNAFLNKEANEK